MKEIRVAQEGDKLVWRVSAEVGKNTEILPSAGVRVMVVHEGDLLMEIDPGTRTTVNEKRLFQRKIGGVYELYAVNTAKRIAMKWGTRKNPEYKDESKGGAILKVQCYGQSEAVVENPKPLFERMLSNGEELTEDTLKTYIGDTLSAVCTETVAGVTNELAEKSKIEAAGGIVEQRMTERFKKSFGREFGLLVEKSVVFNIKVTGAEEIDRKTNDLVVSKLDTRLSGETKAQALDSVEVLKELNNAVSPKAGTKKTEVASEPRKCEKEEKDYKFCVECGKKLPKDARFCSDCGRRQ